MSGHLTGVRCDVNPSAIYIHCHAHQLNLVLVDTCRTVPHASNFFSLLESVYAFISSSVPHSIFTSKQKELGFTREIQLKKLSDTRWSCWHSSINAIMTTIQTLLHTLEEISQSRDAHSIEARGLLFKCSHFLFSCLLFFLVVSLLSPITLCIVI